MAARALAFIPIKEARTEKEVRYGGNSYPSRS
jgi:hypothetical protein